MNTFVTETFVPEEFYCPISGDLMTEPVSEAAGHTYEKDQIMRWLQTKQTSPMTNLPLHIADLTPNLAMKRSIESIRHKLHQDQLKIDSRIALHESKEFIDSLDEITVNTYYHDGKLLVSVNTPDIETRPPVDIVLCIDVSGSMGTEATLKGDSGETIRNGISVLSLTVAAAKTIIASLNEKDNISVVTYTDKAKTIIENMSCSEENKISMGLQLDQLRPLNTTNLWQGINQSLDLLHSTSPECRQKAIFLLTDGVPNIVPPRGHEYMIEKYQRQNDFHCPINCYGFGYDLDSPLLDNISKMTGGDGYAFIPDSSLLGTVFIHGIANFLTTATTNVQLNVSLKRDICFMNNKQEKTIMINSLKYGQNKDFIFEIDGDDEADDFAVAILTFKDKQICSDEVNVADTDHFYDTLYRLKGIDIMNQCYQLQKFNEKEQVKQLINPFIDILKRQTSEFIRDMTIDFEGQVKEALNMTSQGTREDWYSRWGKHYLLSLVSAYQNQLCVNFKDKGIRHFGGTLFETLRDTVSDIFDDQPPPKIDVVQHTSYRGGTTRGTTRGGQYPDADADGASAPAPAPVSMSSYNNAIGGCCSHNSMIMDDNGIYTSVKSLKKGDKIMTFDEMGNSVPSEIECVIKTLCPSGILKMISVDDLEITDYHPIMKDGSWVFPLDVGEHALITTPYIYSFIVKNRMSVKIDEYIYATWGHELTGPVIGHEYFGTEKVIGDIKQFPLYYRGVVYLEPHMFKRGNDNHVCGILDNKYYATL